MAEVNALILPIGADPKQFTKSIDEVKAALKSLEKEIKAKKFDAITQKDRENLEGYRRTLVELNNSLNDVNFDKLEKGSKGARTAVTSLNLVVQDLPFGFIAIQNNLPGLIQSFGQLSAASGGTVGALKAIGASLIGPAGLFLAFTAVTSAVTFAIQEYGSLRNAINVLFGANGAAVKAQNEFNKALLDGGGDASVQIAKINILVKTIQSETSTQNERLAAYRELKRISPDVVSGINEQNLATITSIKLIGENAKAVIDLLKLQVKQKGIESALGKLEEERFAINGKYLAARRAELALDDEINAAKERQAKNLPISSRQNVLITKEKGFRDAAAESVKKYRDELILNTNSQDSWYKSLEQNITATSQINSNLETLQNNLQAQIDSASKLKDKINDENKEWENFLQLTAKSNQRLAEYYATQLQLQADKNLQNKLKADAEAYKLLEKALYDVNEANAQFGIETLKTSSIIDTRYAQSIIDSAGILNRFRDAQFKGANAFQVYKDQIKNFEDIKSSIENNLTKPFREFFDELLSNGKVSFEGFVQLAKDAFKRILAQAIASSIASLLANILTGGVAQIAQAKIGAAGDVAKKLTSFGGIFGLRREAAPSFSGIQGGGMNMKGEVIFVQRGSDLVGVLNRTNTTIGRIG